MESVARTLAAAGSRIYYRWTPLLITILIAILILPNNSCCVSRRAWPWHPSLPDATNDPQPSVPLPHPARNQRHKTAAPSRFSLHLPELFPILCRLSAHETLLLPFRRAGRSPRVPEAGPGRRHRRASDF